MFTQPGQWRNLIEQPELLSALQPNDVRPAGTCDITAGRGPELADLQLRRRPPTGYQRVQHAVIE